MPLELALRLLAAVAFLAVVLAIAVVTRNRAAARRRRALAAPAHADLATGRPTILYFHGDHCADCVAQERELDALLSARPEVAIRADHAPGALSARFGVLMVPTTVILDGAGRARAVNYGLARRATLEKQLGLVDELAASA